MSNEAAAGDMRTMSPGVAWSLAVWTASVRDSTVVNLWSWYFWARAWPDSPRRMIFLILGDWRIS